MSETERLAQDIAALAGNTPTRKTLAGRTAASPLPAVVASAKPSLPGSQGTSGAGGIASPLVETTYGDRTFHDAVTFGAPNGMFTVVVRPLASLSQQDAGGRPVLQQFDAPA